MRALSWLLPLALAFATSAAVSCADESESDADAADDLCRAVGTTICAEACACGGCAITTGGGAASVSFDDEADCTAFYIDLGCQESDSTIDFEACSSALESAGCVDGPGGDPALDLPDACA